MREYRGTPALRLKAGRRGLLLASVAVTSLLVAGVAMAAPPGTIYADGVDVGPVSVDIQAGFGGRAVTAVNDGVVTITDGQIRASGSASARAFGILAGHGGHVSVLDGMDLMTTGARAHAVQAGFNGTGTPVYDGSSAGSVMLGAGTYVTDGDYAVVLHAVDSGTINASGIVAVANGINSPAVHAESASTIFVSGSDLATTAGNSPVVLANNNRGSGAGGEVVLENTSVTSSGAWSHGIVAEQSRSSVVASDVHVSTSGERGFGLLAHTGGSIEASGSIVTTGLKAHGVQAGKNGTGSPDYGLGGGYVGLTGGSVGVSGDSAVGLHALDGGRIDASGVLVATGGSAGFGIHAESLSVVNFANGSIETAGIGAIGVLANNDAVTTGGVVNISNSSVTANGRDSHGVVAEFGGQVNLDNSQVVARGVGGIGAVFGHGGATVTGGSITSAAAEAVRLTSGGNLLLNNTHVFGATASINNVFDGAGQASNITIGAGSVVGSASGVLLNVDRSVADAADGTVNLVLASGSNSAGAINDLGPKTTGYTDVIMEKDAIWSGSSAGIRNFVAHLTGGELTFGSGSQIAGNILGNGTLVRFGDAVVIGGDLSLRNGSVTTGGTIVNPTEILGGVIVDETSWLGGNLRIGGGLFSEGGLRPGNSLGVVTVGGNLALGGSSVYQVEINATGNSDLVRVGGSAALAGRVEVSPYPANGGYLVGTPYTIVTAAGGLGGTTFDGGATWTGDALPIFLAPNLSYDANNAYVTIGRSSVSMVSVALTPNQMAAAGGIDRLPVTNALFNAVAYQSSVQGARQAFGAVSGEAYASLAGAYIEESHVVRDAVNNRLRDAAGGQVAAADKARTKAVTGLTATLWGQAFGTWGQSSSRGIAKADRSSAGFIAGIDAPVFDNGRLGVAAGYSRTSVDVDQRLSSASADSYHLSLYGGTQFGALGLRFGAAYTWNDATANRAIVFPNFSDATRSSYRSGVAQVFGEASYGVKFGATSVEPFLNLAWVNLESSRFVEYGGAAALGGRVSAMNTTFTTFGTRVAHTFEMGSGYSLTAQGTVGWRHAFGDVDPRSWMTLGGGASAFTVTGAPIARNSLLLEAGLDLNVAPNVSVGVGWTGQIAEHAQDHAVKGNFSVRF